MANKNPNQAAVKRTHRAGLVPGTTVDRPGGKLVSRGVPAHLKNPLVAGGGQPLKAPIPGADAVIVDRRNPALDGATAGSENIDTGKVPNNGAIPSDQRAAIVPPDGFHVP